MDQFFSLKSMLYMVLGGVSAVFFCFTKQPVMDFFYKLFMTQHVNMSMTVLLLALMQIVYVGCLIGLSELLVRVQIKD